MPQWPELPGKKCTTKDVTKRCDVQDATALLEDLACFTDLLQSLRRFAVVNTVAIVKITKKHDKRSPIPVQPIILPVCE